MSRLNHGMINAEKEIRKVITFEEILVHVYVHKIKRTVKKNLQTNYLAEMKKSYYY